MQGIHVIPNNLVPEVGFICIGPFTISHCITFFIPIVHQQSADNVTFSPLISFFLSKAKTCGSTVFTYQIQSHILNCGTLIVHATGNTLSIV